MSSVAESKPETEQHPLDPLLTPRSIALVGASPRLNSAGNALLTMAGVDGYGGRLYPVNPRYDRIDDLRCFPSIEALPEIPEHAVLALPNAGLEAAVEAAISAGIRALTIFASCRPEGDDGLADRIAAKARAAGVAICGGNCMGFYNVQAGLRVAGFLSPQGIREGGIAWIAQSGSAFSALTHHDRRLGFCLAVSSGMELTTGVADYIDWALAQPQTRVIGLFIEAVRAPGAFERALSKAARAGMPVVALKVGRTSRSAAMALTHTGAIAGDDAAYTGLFRRHGVLQVDDLDEMAATLALFDAPRPARPGGVATIHDSGGERELFVDMAEGLGVPLARIGSTTRTRLASNLEAGLLPENPLDAWGTDRDYEARYRACMEALLDDPAVALGVFFSDVRDDYWYSAGILRAVAAAGGHSEKPVAIASNFGLTLDTGIAREAARLGVPVLKGTRPSLVAIGHVLRHAARQVAPKESAPPAAPGVATRRWRTRLGQGPLSEAEALAMLSDFGVVTPRCEEAASLDQVQAASRQLRPPYVLKTAENHAHKSDVGGVVVGIGADQVVSSWRSMAERLGPRVTVAEMAPSGVEIGLGARIDPDFGPVMIVSAGGTLIELMDDRAAALAPIGREDARDLLASLRVRRLLDGVRGAAPADVEALLDAIAAFSVMVAALAPGLEEIDVNPVIAGPNGAVAVDCLVVAKREN